MSFCQILLDAQWLFCKTDWLFEISMQKSHSHSTSMDDLVTFYVYTLRNSLTIAPPNSAAACGPSAVIRRPSITTDCLI